jgi:hypothetical protein
MKDCQDKAAGKPRKPWAGKPAEEERKVAMLNIAF